MLERPDMKKQVLYAPPPGDQASEAMRTMWHAVDVPADELQLLLKGKCAQRTTSPSARSARQREKARNEAAARRSGPPRRVVTNHHLLHEDPALFATRCAAAAQAAQAAKGTTPRRRQSSRLTDELSSTHALIPYVTTCFNTWRSRNRMMRPTTMQLGRGLLRTAQHKLGCREPEPLHQPTS